VASFQNEPMSQECLTSSTVSSVGGLLNRDM